MNTFPDFLIIYNFYLHFFLFIRCFTEKKRFLTKTRIVCYCVSYQHYPGLWCVNPLELAEDVGVLGRDAGGLQDGDSEGEGAADLQVRQSFLRGEVQRKIQTQACTLGWALGSFDGFMEEKKI